MIALALVAAPRPSCAQGGTSRTVRIDPAQPIDSITTVLALHIDDREDIGQLEHLIFIDPFKMLAHPNIGYLHTVGDRLTIGATLQRLGGMLVETRESSGYGIVAEVRYFFSATPMRGFGLEASFDFNHVTYVDRHDSTRTDIPTSFGIAGIYHLVVGDHLSGSSEIGADYNITTTYNGILFLNTKNDTPGIHPSMRFTVGYAW